MDIYGKFFSSSYRHIDYIVIIFHRGLSVYLEDWMKTDFWISPGQELIKSVLSYVRLLANALLLIFV